MEAERKKDTAELVNEIKDCNDPDLFVSDNKEELLSDTFADFFKDKMRKYDVKKSELFKRAGMVGNNYAYEVVRGDKKNPSRDVILRLCLAFPLDIDETQQALRYAGKAPLYPRDKRDVYVMFAIKNRNTLDELNDTLTEKGLKIFE